MSRKDSKKRSSKRFDFFKKARLHNFIHGVNGHTLATWQYIREHFEREDDQKYYPKRNIPFLERSARYRNMYWNKAKKDVGSGLFYTHHLMGEEQPEHGFIDVKFLSRKHKGIYYIACIRPAFSEIIDESHGKFRDMFLDVEEKAKDSFLFGKMSEEKRKEYYQKWKEEALAKEIEFKAYHTSFKKDYSYSYGVGLEIILNNGKTFVTDKEIEEAVQLFLDNGEEDIQIEVEQDYTEICLEFIARDYFTTLFYADFSYRNIAKKLIGNEITQEEYDIYLNINNLPSKSPEEYEYHNATHKKVHNLLYNSAYEKDFEEKREEIRKAFVPSQIVKTLNLNKQINCVFTELRQKVEDRYQEILKNMN